MTTTNPFAFFGNFFLGYLFAKAIRLTIDAVTYPIEDGCLENLDYCSHSRAKNWIAYVHPNRAAPGGLDREFWRRGSGAWYAMPRPPVVGDVIEMAGDYYTGRGSKRPDRRYILVTEVHAEYLVAKFIGETAPSAKALREASTAA